MSFHFILPPHTRCHDYKYLTCPPSGTHHLALNFTMSQLSDWHCSCRCLYTSVCTLTSISFIWPWQVLRYQRHGETLWVSDNIPDPVTGIPKCSCGSERTFEFQVQPCYRVFMYFSVIMLCVSFQVMPQLLNHFKVDSLDEPSIDWGTLAVFTCKRGCNEGMSYHEEFIFKQSFSSSATRET